MTKAKRPPRVDEQGRAFAGSQLQTQIYVSRRTSDLSDSVARAINVDPVAITWVAPRESNHFKEPMDGSFLEALRLPHLRDELKQFWPKRGPSWDALAIVEGEDGPIGYVLAEGKSYPREMIGSGCAAGDSKVTIERSLQAAKEFFQVPTDVDWLGDLYQYANRLAHVHFLMKATQKSAWLVNLCFTDDPTKGSTSADVWRTELGNIKKQLGFTGGIPHTADVFLPGLAREELSQSSARSVLR